ncbi:hypothetical protein N0V90_005734 [Kalmusia sp. IMI 367209]|nr:hypothetical protein N0V90_005734 [Kalmusia sp. IMI 367209]
MPSPRLLTAQTCISSFATLSIPTFETVLADNYTHDYAPSSLTTALANKGYPTPTAFLEHIASIQRVMTGFPVTAKAWIEDPEQNSVWCWAKSRAEWREEVMDGNMKESEEGEGKGGRKEWEYEGEYVFMFWMDESGEKIVKTVEMLDSWATRERLLILSGRARENLKKVSGTELPQPYDLINRTLFKRYKQWLIGFHEYQRHIDKQYFEAVRRNHDPYHYHNTGNRLKHIEYVDPNADNSSTSTSMIPIPTLYFQHGPDCPIGGGLSLDDDEGDNEGEPSTRTKIPIPTLTMMPTSAPACPARPLATDDEEGDNWNELPETKPIPIPTLTKEPSSTTAKTKPPTAPTLTHKPTTKKPEAPTLPTSANRPKPTKAPPKDECTVRKWYKAKEECMGDEDCKDYEDGGLTRSCEKAGDRDAWFCKSCPRKCYVLKYYMHKDNDPWLTCHLDADCESDRDFARLCREWYPGSVEKEGRGATPVGKGM